jgi:hypothetical protein
MCGCHLEVVWMFGAQLFHMGPLNRCRLARSRRTKGKRTMRPRSHGDAERDKRQPSINALSKGLLTLNAERNARLMRLLLPSNLNDHRETKTRRCAQVKR